MKRTTSPPVGHARAHGPRDVTKFMYMCQCATRSGRRKSTITGRTAVEVAEKKTRPLQTAEEKFCVDISRCSRGGAMEISLCWVPTPGSNPSARRVTHRLGPRRSLPPQGRQGSSDPARQVETLARGSNNDNYDVKDVEDVKDVGDGGEQARNASSWTPFSLPEADPCTRPRVQRMVETRRGDPYVEEPTHRDGIAVDAADMETDAPATTGDGCCSHCQGTGQQVCAYCNGTGRTNYKDRVMLPKGVWPMWCSRCIRCSGMTICSCCLGSGEKREPIGFRV